MSQINTVSFPGLGGLEFTMDRVAFSIGGFAVYWYGIIMAVAFLAGIAYILKRVREFGLDGDRVFDVILIGIAAGIVGARLYYVIFRGGYDNVVDVFSTRSGGLAIYGGLIGAFIAAMAGCKIRRVQFRPLFDLAVGGIILGQAIGRWANFVNVEAYGSNTGLPWGMQSAKITGELSSPFIAGQLRSIGVTVDPNLPVHPTFLYESLWCLLGFGLIMWFTKRRRFDGQLSLMYLVWYGAGRFFIEGLRTDSLLLGNARISQIVALLCVFAAGGALVFIISKIKRENDTEYMKLYVHTEEAQAILAGTFYPKKSVVAGSTRSPSEESNGETDSVGVNRVRPPGDEKSPLEGDAPCIPPNDDDETQTHDKPESTDKGGQIDARKDN